MTHELAGKTVAAEVVRVEEYGLYLEVAEQSILVLITESSQAPIKNLKDHFTPRSTC